MKAFRITSWGQPPEVVEVPDPAPGPGEVVVKVGGAGACHSDVHVMDYIGNVSGWPSPMTLGHENAGWVAALGAGVTGLREGDPVAVHGPWGCGRCNNCRRGMENYCERSREIPAAGGGLGRDGGMAEFMLVPSARHLVPLGSLDPSEAAPLTDAGLTPYHAVTRSLHLLGPNSTAVVIGVGGLGHMAIQILRALSPARIVALDASPDKLDLAREVGADHAVSTADDASAQVRSLAGEPGAQLALDFVGAQDTMALAASVVRPLGHLTIVGLAGGTLPFSMITVPWECSVQTVYWGSVTELAEVIALAHAGKIAAHVERFPLTQAGEAYERMREGSLRGRAVIVP
jgi:propanol-preferring alcohol dehydrogenase